MAKTSLRLDVEYDDRVTDPEAIAAALDRLLETALSIPKVLEEYGTVHIRPFRILATKRPPPSLRQPR